MKTCGIKRHLCFSDFYYELFVLMLGTGSSSAKKINCALRRAVNVYGLGNLLAGVLLVDTSWNLHLLWRSSYMCIKFIYTIYDILLKRSIPRGKTENHVVSSLVVIYLHISWLICGFLKLVDIDSQLTKKVAFVYRNKTTPFRSIELRLLLVIQVQ